MFLSSAIAVVSCDSTHRDEPVPARVPLSSALEAELAQIESQSPAYQMRSALRALASAEDQFYKAHGYVTGNLDSLRQMPACMISRHVQVSIVGLSVDGWASRSRHPSLPGLSCVQWVSGPNDVPVPLTDLERRRGDVLPGGVVCDSLPP